MTAVTTRPSRPDAVAPTAPVTESAYRPQLDGLRAVAVLLVVLFHSGLSRFTGGFVGVDVFFVLSGYLVTQVLLRDMKIAGRPRYGRFYARRMRRLLPAAAVMLVVTAVVYSAIAGPGEASASRHDFQSSFLYVANWSFLHDSAGYFGASIAQSPLLHVWSLAVEEQFYLLWPLLLGGLFFLARRFTRRPAVMVRTVVVVAGISSLIWALVLQHTNPNRAYYGTDARAYELLAGATLALIPGLFARLRRRVPSGSTVVLAPVATFVVLGVLASSMLTMGPITRTAWVTVLTMAIITLLETYPHGPTHRVLSSGPIVYLGKISYGIYLWHWPVIVVAIIVASPSALSTAAITLLVATGLAAASAELLELPVRRSPRLDHHRVAVIAVGSTVGVVGALVVVPAVLHTTSARSEAVTSRSTGFTPVPRDLDLNAVAARRYGDTIKCTGEAPSACTVVSGHGPHILLMGDSSAQMYIPAFEAMAKAHDLTLSLSVTSGCPWQQGVNPLRARSPGCNRNRDDAYQRVIPALRPDVIVAADTEYAMRLVPTDRMREVTSSSIAALSAPSRKIVLVEPAPRAPKDSAPLRCLQDAKYLEDCRFIADTAPSRTDTIYRDAAQHASGVTAASFDSVACPYYPICDPVIGGHVVRWDSQHLARDFSASIADELYAYFQHHDLL